MRKLMLISAFVLASVSAQAGEGRNLILAANDEPRAVETAKPEATKPEVNKSEATAADVKADTARSDSGKRHASRPARKSHARNYEGDEAKARRIAARYGVYW